MSGINAAGNASNPCAIEQFELISDRRAKPFNLAPYIAAIDYYEDVFSPTITMKVMILSESQNVTDQTEEEDDEVDKKESEPKDTDFKALYDLSLIHI